LSIYIYRPVRTRRFKIDGPEAAAFKPCPFCGGGARIKSAATVIIECKKCGALIIKMSLAEAVKAWEPRCAA
jgi:ribosomal protein L37AE/L43A